MLTTPDHDDAVTSPPAFAPVGPRPQGFYQDCDPPTGRAGTFFRAEDLNELALNLRRFVTASGLTPTKGDPTTLHQALNRLYAGGGRTVVASVTLAPADAGLIIVDATNADVTITLPSAAALPEGELTYYLVRLDISTHTIRLAPAAGEVIQGGVVWLDDPVSLRADGVNRWFPLTRAMPNIRRALTLNVATTGVAEPKDPIAGDPFDRIERALAWLDGRAIVGPDTVVTIAVAAGTYTYTGRLSITSPQGPRIAIVGAAAGTTILSFVGSVGVVIYTGLYDLRTLTIRGNSAGTASHGLWLLQGARVNSTNSITIQSFTGNGLRLEQGSGFNQTAGSLLVIDNGDDGVFVANNAILTFSRLDVQRNANYANVNIQNGILVGDFLTSQGGTRGLALAGPGALGSIRHIEVSTNSVKAQSVQALNGAMLIAAATAISGDWVSWDAAGGFGTFLAQFYGAMNSLGSGGTAFGSSQVVSPARNTLGNIQSYIQA
jgi:hypothetical protein